MQFCAVFAPFHRVNASNEVCRYSVRQPVIAPVSNLSWTLSHQHRRRPSVLFGCIGVALACGAPLLAQSAPLGAGLNGISDWSRTNEFADLVKQSRSFGSPGTPWDESAPVDARGWPSGDAGVVLMCCQPAGTGLGGVYRISFECAATPTIQPVASSGSVRNIRRDSATGVVTAEYVQPEGGDQIMLAFRNTNGGIRNLSIMRPGTTDGQLFSPALLAHQRRFRVARFMDWTQTNNNPVATWDQRTRVEDATWRWRTGVPYEVCIDLCNELDQDMWINVPHLADDEFVRNLARLIRDRLEPQLNVYVEYSNEVWNWQFSQAVWNWQQAVAEVEAGPSTLSYDGDRDHNIIRWRRVAREVVEIGQIFAAEFGPGSLNTRVRPILAAQIVWDAQYDVGLRYIQAIFGEPRNFIWAIAGAPYFNLGSADERTDLTASEALDALSASINRWNASITYERIAAYSTWHRLRPVHAYEGGPDTFGPNNIAAKRAASYDARMRELCNRYLSGWYAAGGGQFQWFVSGAGDWNTQYGTWTLTEVMTDQDTPKILAMDDTLTGPLPPLSAGVALPVVTDGRRHILRGDTWQTGEYALLRNGSERDFLVRAPRSGAYRVRLEIYGYESTSDAEILVNGVRVGPIDMGVTAPWDLSNADWFDGATIALPEGLSVIRVRGTGGWFRLRSVGVLSLGDANCDGAVNFSDIESFVAALAGEAPYQAAQPGCVWLNSDLNADGLVNFDDIGGFVGALVGG